MRRFPRVERELFHHVAMSTALRVLANLPSYTGYTLDQLRQQLLYSHVRLVRPMSEVIGLAQFLFVFVVHGHVEDTVSRRSYQGPALIPTSVFQLRTLPANVERYEREEAQRLTGSRAMHFRWNSYVILLFVTEEDQQQPSMLYDDDILPPAHSTEEDLVATSSVNTRRPIGARGSGPSRMSMRSMKSRPSDGDIHASSHKARLRSHWASEKARTEQHHVTIREIDPATKRSSLLALSESLKANQHLRPSQDDDAVSAACVSRRLAPFILLMRFRIACRVRRQSRKSARIPPTRNRVQVRNRNSRFCSSVSALIVFCSTKCACHCLVY